jgi:hypothetical protein
MLLQKEEKEFKSMARLIMNSNQFEEFKINQLKEGWEIKSMDYTTIYLVRTKNNQIVKEKK